MLPVEWRFKPDGPARGHDVHGRGAAMSLARLWTNKAGGPKRVTCSRPVYGWFTEGFDAADLKRLS